MVVPARLAWLALLLGFGFTSPLHGQAQARVMVTQAINNQQRVVVRNSQHPLARPEFEISEIDPALRLQRMLLVLTPPAEREAELRAFLESQHDQTSPNFHHWLTPEEFGEKFGPASQDIQTVTTWLQQQGFTVNSVAKSGRWIEFSGTSGQVERTFQTLMAQYEAAGQLHVANAQEISIPQALAQAVGGIVSLHNFLKKPLLAREGQLRRESDGTYSQIDPNFTSSRGLHALGPADFKKIYNVVSAADGTAQTIAIVARSDVSISDTSDFRQQFGVPFQNPINIINGPDPGFDSNSPDSVEATLDAQWAGALAPQAAIDVVASRPTLTTDGVDLSAAYIVDNNIAGIMSASFGECERDLGAPENAFIRGLWQQAAAEGISVFVSSGDNGSAGCDDPGANTSGTIQAVSGLASTPFNTAVGGTQFNEGTTPATFWSATNSFGIESAIGYIPENVWNESCGPGTTACPANSAGITVDLFAGSGGASTLYSKLDAPWQNLNGVQVGDGQRDLPDVSLTAAGGHDPYLICLGGSCSGPQPGFFGIGGTSASSPAFAGIMALINQSVGTRQGLPNYLLYKLAGGENFSACNSSARTNPSVPASANCIFNDVTSGTNAVPGVAGFAAVAGYDKSTGLGSVNVGGLISAWTAAVPTLAATTTTLTPFTISGTHGAPVAITVQVSGSTTAPPTGAVSLQTSKASAAGANLPAESVLLSGSAFSGSIFDLPGGTYSLTANYSGDANNRASGSIPVTVQISPEASSTAEQMFGINSAGTAIIPITTLPYGAFMNLHAAIAGASGHGIATGTVTFKDGAGAIASAGVNQKGESDLFFLGATPPTALTVGAHTLTASYGGDDSFNTSSSTSLNLTVTKGNPAVAVTAQNTTVISGQQTSLTLVVGNTGPILPTGTVQLFDGPAAIGGSLTIPPGTNQVSAQAILNSDGPHNMTASYSGDSVYNAATSQPLVLTITAPFSIGSNTPSLLVNAGQTATFGLTVTNALPSSFTGAVALSCTAPAGTTCSLNPASVNLSATATQVPVTLSVATTLSARLRHSPFGGLNFAFAALFAGVLLTVKRKPKHAAIGMFALLFVIGLSSCGGGSSAPPFRPPTNAQVVVTGTSGTQTSSVNLSLTITH
ncbi:MAG TPA: Ig-like domain repeat protein [Terriglobales bacterium]|nr:Ig-like domain repeat protein [Terriglobales bacterium]